jgi:gas vesicle protein
VARERGNFVAGLLTGALVGASVAMVLAPGPEETMRDRLRAKAREVAERQAGASASGMLPD